MFGYGASAVYLSTQASFNFAVLQVPDSRWYLSEYEAYLCSRPTAVGNDQNRGVQEATW